MGGGERGRPLPTTHGQHGPMRVGSIGQPESGKEGAGDRSNCVESGRMQWASRQTQIPTTTSFVQTLKYAFSAVSGYETRVCRYPAGSGTAIPQPAARVRARSTQPRNHIEQSLTSRPVRAGQHLTAEGGGQTACRADGNRLQRRCEQLAPKLWRKLRAVTTGLLAAVFDSLARISRHYQRWRHREAADDDAAAVATTDRPSVTTRRSSGQSAPSAECTARECSDSHGAGRPA